LRANHELSFVGARVGGIGFVLSDEERKALLKDEPTTAKIVAPYLGGEEVNTSPNVSFERWVIDFGKRSLQEAEHWPIALERVRTLVKPEREARRGNEGTAGHGKKYWWQFVERGDAFKEAISGLRRCLVVALVTKHLAFAWQPLDRVLANTLGIIALDSDSAFAVLQSRIHEPWVRLLSSSLEDRLRYAASDCFANFPFPMAAPRTVLPELEIHGAALYAARSLYMLETDQGLTKTYNALKDSACEDPRILELRRLHEAMDRAVLDAYGWKDIEVPPFCPSSDAERAAVQAFEDEVIDRLYVLNAERAREEQRLGTAAAKASTKTAASDELEPKADAAPKKKPSVTKKAAKEQGKLFDS
jgi:hypothetical protein